MPRALPSSRGHTGSVQGSQVTAAPHMGLSLVVTHVSFPLESCSRRRRAPRSTGEGPGPTVTQWERRCQGGCPVPAALGHTQRAGRRMGTPSRPGTAAAHADRSRPGCCRLSEAGRERQLLGGGRPLRRRTVLRGRLHPVQVQKARRPGPLGAQWGSCLLGAVGRGVRGAPRPGAPGVTHTHGASWTPPPPILQVGLREVE